mmetsp:Transcript_34551/g.99159  ORF Transcript_34551/g.99159 Transcript_34551/m.99159 type:complete len:646 (+) Transcript_34551:65-2002(+)
MHTFSYLCLLFAICADGLEPTCRSDADGGGAPGCAAGGEAETTGLMQLPKRSPSRKDSDLEDIPSLQDLLKKTKDLGGYTADQVTNLFNCVFVACLDFLNPDNFQACVECADQFVHGVRSHPIGVNSVALGYAADMLYVGASSSYTQAWCDGDIANCTVKENFPGPNTTSIMGWDRVAEMSSKYPEKEWSGEWWRGNELGFIINNPFFWSRQGIDPLSIVLGVLPSQHAAIRPLMETMFTLGPKDSARYKEVQGIVSDTISGFLTASAQRGLKVPDDLKVLVHQILNQVAFNRTVSVEYSQEFVDVQSSVVALGTVSQILPSVLYPFLKPTRDKITKFVDEYASLIQERWGDVLEKEDCSPSKSCVQQAAHMVFDAFYSAGGLSVPTTMGTGVGLLFSGDDSSPFPGASYLPEQAESFYWENIRYFPPVVGFPHWETRPTCPGSTAKETSQLNGTDGSTEACKPGKRSHLTGYPEVNQYQGGVRVVPNLALAQRDPAKWGADADQFVIRPLWEYNKSLGFAEKAVDDSVAGGKMNRDCPGKALALMIGTSFFAQFKKDDWAKPFEDIKFGNGPLFVSSFTLNSKKMIDSCEEVCPECSFLPPSLSCLAESAKCEAEKHHCKLCKECTDNPPPWWNLARKAACLTC